MHSKVYMDKSKPYLKIILISMLVLTLITIFLEFKYFDKTIYNDYSYYSISREIKEKNIISYPLSELIPTAYRMPLYPIFLSLFNSSEKARNFQMFLFITFTFIVTLFLSKAANLITSILFFMLVIIQRETIFYSKYLTIESFYSLILTLSLIVTAISFVNKKFYLLLLGCFLTGVSLTVRSPLFLSPLVMIYFAINTFKNFKKNLIIFLILSFTFMPIMPWVVRNFIHYRKFIPFEYLSQSCNLYLASQGYIENDEGHYKCYINPLFNEKDSGYQKNKILLSNAIDNIIKNPIRYTVSTIKRFLYIFYHFQPLFFLILISYFYKKNIFTSFLTSIFLYFLLIHSLFAIEERYFIPLFFILNIILSIEITQFLFDLINKPFELHFDFKWINFFQFLSIFFILLWSYSIYILIKEIKITGFIKKDLNLEIVETIYPEAGMKEEIYLNSIGVYNVIKGNVNEGQKNLEKAIEINPYYIDPYVTLITIYRKNKNYKRADELCIKANEILNIGKYSIREKNMLKNSLNCLKNNLNPNFKFNKTSP